MNGITFKCSFLCLQARIVLERRRFLKDAETAVQRQAMWSNLAHEMTAEFRGLCAEEVCSSLVVGTDLFFSDYIRLFLMHFIFFVSFASGLPATGTRKT